MNVLEKVDEKKHITWTSQVRYDPVALAELARYLQNRNVQVNTKSMLVACCIEMLRDILADNNLLPKRLNGVAEALHEFNEMGFRLPSNRRAQLRIMKSLQIDEGAYNPRTDMESRVQEAQRQLKAAGMEVTPDAATPEELDEQQKAKDIDYLNKQQELGSRPNGKEEA